MDDIAIAMAKIAGIRKATAAALDEQVGRHPHYMPRDSYPPDYVKHYFLQAEENLQTLKKLLPGLYGDFQDVYEDPHDQRVEFVDGGRQSRNVTHYGRKQLERLVRDLDQIMEIRANSELAHPTAAIQVKEAKRVFISHGRSKDWLEIQAYIERDIGLATLELAQEANAGQTIIEKLEANASNCDSAVLVMTGDDIDNDGQARARENVMHEIGFFQAKYGRSRVCLLHEEGVSIPTNLSGVVYVPFPKGSVGAGFGVLVRELKAIYKI
ncbi:nucleotide-binding protein [Burkholderia sp. JSH-S8]|nr:nucleotide-binding protein [Burkholderia sp. JSH-S8]